MIQDMKVLKSAVVHLRVRREAIVQARLLLEELCSTPIHCKEDAYLVHLGARALVMLQKASPHRVSPDWKPANV